MVWTNQKPTRQGWYWFKEANDCAPVAVEVRVWRLDAGVREDLYMFYRPNDPEETGVYLLDEISDGEWLGPIEPFDRPPEPVIVERIVEKPSEPIIIEKIVEKLVPTVEPQKPVIPLAGSHNGNSSDARAIIDWFIAVGTDHFPNDVQGEYVVRLANMLAYSLKLGRKFEVVTDVIKFLVEEGDTE